MMIDSFAPEVFIRCSRISSAPWKKDSLTSVFLENLLCLVCITVCVYVG